MNTQFTLGSLFAGIGGFDEGFRQAGFETIWAVEIDKQAQSIFRRHFPDAEMFDDVKDVGAHNLAPVDVITFGSPCQDLSVAGKRAGMEGERSGLFYEAVRVIDELRPSFALWENVPGALSSNKGRDIQAALEALTNIGYVCDMDIKDAQEFGVPQRRRRIFVLCVRSDVLLQKRMSSFANAVMDLTVQLLLAKWDDILRALSPEQRPSGFALPIEGWRGSPEKRMKLFVSLLGRNPLRRLVDYWTGDRAVQFCSEWIESASDAAVDGRGDTLTVVDTEIFQYMMNTGREYGLRSISETQDKNWDERSGGVKSFTTLTETNSTTPLKTCIFARTIVNMLDYILPLMHWSQNSWSAASSCSILIQEITDYARQASNELFTEDSLRRGWRDCFDVSSGLSVKLDRYSRNVRAAEILFEPESVCRHLASGGKAGTGTARGTTRGTREGSERELDQKAYTIHAAFSTAMTGGGDAAAAFETERARTLDSSGGFATNQGGNVVVSTLQGGGKRGQRLDAEMAAGGHQVPTSVGFHLTQDPISSDDKTPAMRTGNAEGCATLGVLAADSPVGALSANGVGASGADDNQAQAGHLLPDTFHSTGQSFYNQSPIAGTDSARDWKDGQTTLVTSLTGERTHALSSEGADASEDGTGRGTPLVLRQAQNQRGEVRTSETAGALSVGGGKPGQGYQATLCRTGVRRLTPTECERLMAFPDSWTARDDHQRRVSDSARYRLLGNSVVVNVVEWIAHRVAAALAESIPEEEAS